MVQQLGEMNLKNDKYLIFFCVLFLTVSAFAIYGTFYTNSNIRAIKRKTLAVDHFNERHTCNPHTDIKLLLLRSHPNLLKTALDNSQSSDARDHDTRIKIFSKYILEDHEGIQDLLSQCKYDRDLISILTVLYLLPAYLYEREGFIDIALRDYNRYYSCYKKLTGTCDFEYRKDVQDRISIVRLKKHFLEYSIPSIRNDYYNQSYFTCRTMNFFDGISENLFLKNYVKSGYLFKTPYGRQCCRYDQDSLMLLLRSFKPSDIPFEAYELLADNEKLQHSMNENTGRMILSNIDSVIKKTSDPFVKSICLFKEAVAFFNADRKDEAKHLFLESIQTEDAESYFLRDDSYYFIAMINCADHLEYLEDSIKRIYSSFKGKRPSSNFE